jgi:hypothetical protein
MILSVETNPIVGNPFTNSCDNWKEGTYEHFKEWAKKQLDVEDSELDDKEEVDVQFKKAKDITFERNEDGDLILPPMEDYQKVRQKQRVVRGYIGAVYRQ